MARIAILSLLALFLVASYASATTLEEICQGCDDAAYCVKLLKNTVESDTDFKSGIWRSIAISRATVRAMMAKDYIAKKMQNAPVSNMDSVKLCGDKLGSSVESLKGAMVEHDEKVNVSKQIVSATADQQACSNALKSVTVQGVVALRNLTDEAIKATATINGVLKKTQALGATN